jgi:hypothetical protein
LTINGAWIRMAGPASKIVLRANEHGVLTRTLQGSLTTACHPRVPSGFQPERLQCGVAQPSRVALALLGEVDNPMGYGQGRRVFPIYQAQFAQGILVCRRQDRDFVGIERMIATENKDRASWRAPQSTHQFRSIPPAGKIVRHYAGPNSLVLWSGVLLGLNLLLLLHHRRRARLVVQGRRLIDRIGGKMFLGLLREH